MAVVFHRHYSCNTAGEHFEGIMLQAEIKLRTGASMRQGVDTIESR